MVVARRRLGVEQRRLALAAAAVGRAALVVLFMAADRGFQLHDNLLIFCPLFYANWAGLCGYERAGLRVSELLDRGSVRGVAGWGCHGRGQFGQGAEVDDARRLWLLLGESFVFEGKGQGLV